MFQGGTFVTFVNVSRIFICYIRKSFREEAVDFTHPFMSLGLSVLGYRGSASRSLQQLADDDSLKVQLSTRSITPSSPTSSSLIAPPPP